jgi:hypothetical protein
MSSKVFQNLFLKLTDFYNKNLEFIDAQRSVTDSTGESDLEITFQSKDKKKYKLLIENKINASFQKNQQERYTLRGNNYFKLNKINDFATILIAPKFFYINNNMGFDFRINYEYILEYFKNNEILGSRKNYKILLLQSAIEKGAKGYQLIADECVGNFWKDYWKLSLEIAKEFNMEQPFNKPSGSSFIYFQHNNILPNNIKLVHKLTHGYFDLQFKDMGDKLYEMENKYSQFLTQDMNIVKANKSASIRIRVPELSLADTVEFQKERVIQGINKGKELLKWFKQNGQQNLENG